jgi:hypothetical protein
VSDKPHRMCSSVHAPRGSNRARGHSRDDVRADVGPACGGKGDAPTDATDANTCCVTRPCTCTGVRLCRRRQESAHGGCLGLGGVSATTRRTGRVPCHTAGAHTVARSSTIAAVSRGVSKPEEQPLEQTAAVVDWEAAHRQGESKVAMPEEQMTEPRRWRVLFGSEGWPLLQQRVRFAAPSLSR